MITPWAFGHFLLRSQGVFALPVGKDSTQRSVQFSGAGSVVTVITAQQNSAMAGLQRGVLRTVDILYPPKGIKVYPQGAL